MFEFLSERYLLTKGDTGKRDMKPECLCERYLQTKRDTYEKES